MNRRALRTTVGAVLFLSAVVASGAPASSQTTVRPNVLIIVTDDQRTSTFSPSRLPTAWSAFAEQGVRFPLAFATTPQCCPSRGSIFTGRYAHNHAVRTNQDAAALDHSDTLQRYLQDAGYRTGIFGKFLNGWRLQENPPFFDEWAVLRPALRGSDGYYDVLFNVNGLRREVSGYSTAYVGDQATRFIAGAEADDARPWLAYVTPYAPHMPATPERRYARAPVARWNPSPSVFETEREDKPEFIRDSQVDLESMRYERTRQLRSLMSVDDLVADLLSTLRATDEENDTLVFFLSDNGYLWGEHGWSGKWVPYTESVNIPMFMRWPGRLEGGVDDGRIVANIDIAPTVLEAAGLPPDPNDPMDGRSLLDTTWTRDRILLEAWRNRRHPTTWASLRTPTHQYTEYYGNDVTPSFIEYYDLVSDPWQLANVLGDGTAANDPPPEAVARLSLRLTQDRVCSGTQGAGACP